MYGHLHPQLPPRHHELRNEKSSQANKGQPAPEDDGPDGARREVVGGAVVLLRQRERVEVGRPELGEVARFVRGQVLHKLLVLHKNHPRRNVLVSKYTRSVTEPG